MFIRVKINGDAGAPPAMPYVLCFGNILNNEVIMSSQVRGLTSNLSILVSVRLRMVKRCQNTKAFTIYMFTVSEMCAWTSERLLGCIFGRQNALEKDT